MKKWISEEETKIRDLTKKGLTEKEIAEKLNKSPQGIKIKRKDMPLRRQGIIVWTEQNIRTMEFLISKGEDNKSIAKILGDNKTEEAVIKKRKELGL